MPSIDVNDADFDAPAGDVDITTPTDDAPDSPADGDTHPSDGDPPGDSDLPTTQVPVFVAQGHGGRLLMSCDYGRSWTYDVNDAPDVVCFAPTDCDHSALSAAGLTYANGHFFASFGHGSADGTLRHSLDGKTWTPLHVGDSQGGVYFNGELLLWMEGHFALSDDLGATLDANLENVPGHYYLSRTIAAQGDVIIASSDDPGGLVSRDGGQTWDVATLVDVRWGRNVFMQTAPDGSLITLSAVHGVQLGEQTYQTVAYAARSTDGGLTWMGVRRFDYVDRYVEWAGMFGNGAQLYAFLDNAMWTSQDGVIWAGVTVQTALPAGQITDGPIGRGPDGTYVTITNVWNNYYEKQRAYRSEDGLHWTQLDADGFTGGHPVHRIVSGWVDAAVCTP